MGLRCSATRSRTLTRFAPVVWRLLCANPGQFTLGFLEPALKVVRPALLAFGPLLFAFGPAVGYFQLTLQFSRQRQDFPSVPEANPAVPQADFQIELGYPESVPVVWLDGDIFLAVVMIKSQFLIIRIEGQVIRYRQLF